MTDLGSQLRTALDRVDPVSIDDIRAAANALRRRRRVAAASGAAIAVVAAVSLVLAPDKDTTRITTRPTGPLPTSPGSSTPGTGVDTLENNPLFRPLREGRVPTGATGALYADGALYTWANIGGQATNVVTRIDIETARVTATVPLRATGAAFARNLLWLTADATPVSSQSGPDEVDALDPITLSVVHKVSIPTPFAGTSDAGIAAAGGLIWTAGEGTLYGIDPGTATIVRRVETPSPPPSNGYRFGPGQYGINIAASPDGSVLWTAESPGGGGFDAMQVRDAKTGAVIYSGTNSVSSIGGTVIAAGDGYAWVAYRTGMRGSYLRIQEQQGMPAAASSTNNVVSGSNAVSVSLAGNLLWVYDAETHHTACADPADGNVLRASTIPVDGIVPLPGGNIAVLSMGATTGATIVIAAPESACR